MGYSAPPQYRGKYKTDHSWYDTPAATTRTREFKFTGVMWACLIRVHDEVNSHLSSIKLVYDDTDEIIRPYGLTYEQLDLYGWSNYLKTKLVQYSVDGICTFQWTFPEGVRIRTKITTEVYNACAAANYTNTYVWWSEASF